MLFVVSAPASVVDVAFLKLSLLPIKALCALLSFMVWPFLISSLVSCPTTKVLPLTIILPSASTSSSSRSCDVSPMRSALCASLYKILFVSKSSACSVEILFLYVSSYFLSLEKSEALLNSLLNSSSISLRTAPISPGWLSRMYLPHSSWSAWKFSPSPLNPSTLSPKRILVKAGLPE